MNVYAYAASVICAIVIGGCLWELISSLIDWIKKRKDVGYVSAVCVQDRDGETVNCVSEVHGQLIEEMIDEIRKCYEECEEEGGKE